MSFYSENPWCLQLLAHFRYLKPHILKILFKKIKMRQFKTQTRWWKVWLLWSPSKCYFLSFSHLFPFDSPIIFFFARYLHKLWSPKELAMLMVATPIKTCDWNRSSMQLILKVTVTTMGMLGNLACPLYKVPQVLQSPPVWELPHFLKLHPPLYIFSYIEMLAFSELRKYYMNLWNKASNTFISLEKRKNSHF